MQTVRDFRSISGWHEDQRLTWNVGDDYGHGVVVTYRFLNGNQLPSRSEVAYSSNAVQSFSTAQQNNIRKALDKIEKVAGIRFVEVSKKADTMIDFYAVRGSDYLGWSNLAYTTDGKTFPGETVLDVSYDAGDLSSDYWQMVTLHEVGHAMGLYHPHEGQYRLAAGIDDTNTTVMSYNDAFNVRGVLGPLDKKALQFAYGENGTMDKLTFSAGPNFWKITGTGQADDFTGLRSATKLYGKKGADTLIGREAKDLMYGGNGQDRLEGNYGLDRLYGGSGNDFLYGGNGSDSIYGGGGRDFLRGDDGADNLFGGPGGDELYAGNGRDTVKGGAGNDSVLGRNGNDELYGGKGADRVFGGDGEDFIEVSTNDTVYGGNGADEFHFSKDAKGGRATISDFAAEDFLEFAFRNESQSTFTEVAGGTLVVSGDGDFEVLIEGWSAADLIAIDPFA